MENSVLRPACLSDVPEEERQAFTMGDEERTFVVVPLEYLYDTEWQKRGFQRSP